MAKIAIGVAVFLVALGAWIVPGELLAWASPDEPETHATEKMKPEDEQRIVPPGGGPVLILPSGAEIIVIGDDTTSPEAVHEQAEAMDRSFALAALAPVFFALLTVGAYAVSRRR